MTKSPPITIALDYFGIRNTHWINQLAGDKAEVQLVIIISDDTGTLAIWPPDPQSQTFLMDFFQVISLKNYMGGDTVLYTGSVTGTLSICVVANNVNKGAITKAQIDIIEAFGGGDLTALKALIPDKELIDTYWQTWLPANNWGIGNQYTNDIPQDNRDLKAWGRIGSANQMPPELSKQPTIKPNVKLVKPVNLPVGVKRDSYNGFIHYYNQSTFTFKIANYESFAIPNIYWRLVSSPYAPETLVNFVRYATEGAVTIPANSTFTVTQQYWFTNPGNYQWTYVLEYPSGNTLDSWTGTLLVTP